MSTSFSKAKIQEIIVQLDYNDNHLINYSEFLAATIDLQKYLSDHGDARLKVIFN